jgi:hypothetical protein
MKACVVDKMVRNGEFKRLLKCRTPFDARFTASPAR